MKIAVGLMDFLDPQPNTCTNNSGPAQGKRSREDQSPGPSRSVDRESSRSRESLPFERREDHRSRSAYSSYPSGSRAGRGRGSGGGGRRIY